jgi:hypothetical protein
MTDRMTLRADFSGAIKKTQVLKTIPAAHKLQATYWSSDTLKELRQSAADRQISIHVHHGKKTGMMGRNTGQVVTGGDGKWIITLGTGIGGHQTVPYALIQDKGGTTHPTVTARMRAWAWFMYGKWKEERYKWLALTKKGKLDINIPASRWFSEVMEKREPVLAAMMQKVAVLRLAEMLAGSSGGPLAKAVK